MAALSDDAPAASEVEVQADSNEACDGNEIGGEPRGEADVGEGHELCGAAWGGQNGDGDGSTAEDRDASATQSGRDDVGLSARGQGMHEGGLGAVVVGGTGVDVPCALVGDGVGHRGEV